MHVVSGSIQVNGESLGEGDGARIIDVDAIEFAGEAESEALVFDLP